MKVTTEGNFLHVHPYPIVLNSLKVVCDCAMGLCINCDLSARGDLVIVITDSQSPKPDDKGE